MKKIVSLAVLCSLFSLFSCSKVERECKFIFHTYSEVEFDSRTVKFEDIETYQLPTPTKEGYTFEGWYLDKGFITLYDYLKIKEDDRTVELYAKYFINEYKIQYNISGDEVESKYYNYEDYIAEFIPDKEGFIFEGWYLDKEYKNEFLYYTMPAENINVYAKWSEVPLKETYLIFNPNNGEYYDPVLVDEETIIEYVLPTPTKEGYTFEGWYLDKEFENEYLVDNINFDLGTILLYAKYSINSYTLTIYKNDQEKVEEQVLFGSSIDLPELNDENFIFNGWYLDSNYSSTFTYSSMPAYDIEAYALWSEKPNYKVSIVSNIERAFTINGKTEQFISYDNPNMEEVEIVSNMGYKFLYYEIEGVKYYSNKIALNNISKDVIVNVFGDYLIYELPIINIDTNDALIESKEDYIDMQFDLLNCDNELKDVTGGIRLRGNSTRRLPKKPYRIKFDKKQALFGLESSKSWVLLADYLDPSGLHNYTAFKIASQMDGFKFVPSPHKVNVYLNGEYIGLYTLCEQIQENPGRIDIEEDITEEMTELKDFNFFICMDKSVIEDSTAILDETYFYLEEYDRYFELKYPEKGAFVNENQFLKFFADLKEYVSYLMEIFTNKNTEKIQEETDIKSLIDYTILDAIMGEQDHSYKSFNMFFEKQENISDSKIQFGPIWDYDWSLYTPWTGEPNESYVVSNKIGYSNVFFKSIEGIGVFYQQLKERYSNVVSSILDECIGEMYSYSMSIHESLLLNQYRWYQDYEENISVNNVILLNRYLSNRKVILDKEWKNN